MKDFSRQQLFAKKWWFAIELEIHEAQRDICKKIFKHTYFSRESGEIWEINNFHHIHEISDDDERKKSRKLSLKVFDYLKNYYKDKFPVWENWYTSWWNHFHLFWDTWILQSKNIELIELLLNIPLFAKFKDGVIYSRRNWRFWFTSNEDIRPWTKRDAIQCNSSHIEFRCNNVIDDRLLWYYQAICIMAHNWIKPELLSKKLTDYLKDWSQENADNWEINRGDVVLSDLLGHYIERNDKEKLVKNINNILDVLRRNNLPRSADNLQDYCIEFNLIPNKKEKC